MVKIKRSCSYPVIVLAAGKSSRMRSPKGLLDYGGKPWLFEQLQRISKAEQMSVTLALGHSFDDYLTALRKAEILLKSGEVKSLFSIPLSIAINPNPDLGPFSSLRTALSKTDSKDWQGCFILPIDVPCPHPLVWDLMANALQEKIECVIPTHNQKAGHPVLLSRTFLTQLIQVPLDSPLARLDRQIQLLEKSKVLYLPVEDEQVTLNLNTHEEWSAYTQKNNHVL